MRELLLLATLGRANAGEVPAGQIIAAIADDGRLTEFRIDSIEPDPADPEGDVHLYGVSEHNPDGSWSRHCAPDAQGRSAAIPLSGSWDATTGVYIEGSESQLTFACTSGAIGKCVRFGYKPWASKDGHSLAPLHAACMRMVRADYCGDGRPHTRDGTQIDVYDPLGVQIEERTAAKREDFEAGWSESGATYLNVPRWSDDVAAIVAECPETLSTRSSLYQKLDSAGVLAAFPETILFNNRIRDEEKRMPKVKQITGAQKAD